MSQRGPLAVGAIRKGSLRSRFVFALPRYHPSSHTGETHQLRGLTHFPQWAWSEAVSKGLRPIFHV
jgi:hypothetical protein